MIAVTSTILMSCDDRHDCHCVVPLHSTPCGTVPPHNGLVALRRVNAASYGLQGNVSKPDECCGLLTGWDRIHLVERVASGEIVAACSRAGIGYTTARLNVSWRKELRRNGD